jgi:uncharacterized protein DUF4198
MRRLVAGAAAALIAAGTIVSAHDFFLHPRGYLLAPRATVTIPVFNGTFTASENAVERGRLRDLSLWGPGGRQAIPVSSWTDRDPRSTVRVSVGGEPGTYAVGVEIAPRTIALAGAAFDAYLAEERIGAMLDRRKATGRMGRAARESYAKAAKALLAVTDASGHLVPVPPAGASPSPARQIFGHAAEIVTEIDPYTLGVGASLPVRCLIGGKPLAGWTIVAGGTIGTSDLAIPAQAVTTDREGRATVRLTHDGHWFIRFVHMREAAAGEGVDYVSRWATLTFGVQPAGSR